MFRELKLVLYGDPLAKQSVKKGKNGFYQDSKYKTKEEDWRAQISNQLPPDWKPYEEFVQVELLEFIFTPTKKLMDRKGSKRWLEMGNLIPKHTTPDLMDNLPKLLFDSLEKKVVKKKKKVVPHLFEDMYVMKNDAHIHKSKGTSKWYGIEPRIIIHLIGY